MDLWIREMQEENAAMIYKVKETLHTEKTKYQELAILDTYEFGRMLVLDGIVQTTIRDEFAYHEMITHIPLFTHNNPKKVLVIGGGDGGTIREILKHKSVEKAVLCEIDERVVELSKKYLPEISCGLSDPRVEVFIGDGIKYVREHNNEFDVAIVDSPDPIGAAVGLFSIDFYSSLYDCLKADGIFTARRNFLLFTTDGEKILLTLKMYSRLRSFIWLRYLRIRSSLSLPWVPRDMIRKKPILTIFRF